MVETTLSGKRELIVKHFPRVRYIQGFFGNATFTQRRKECQVFSFASFAPLREIFLFWQVS